MTTSRGLGRQLVENTLHAASGRVFAVVVWLLLMPWILRALGRDGFAVWSLFFALTGYLAALDFGLAQGTLKHVAAASERGEHDKAGAFATLAVIGYLMLGAVWLGLTLAAREAVLDWLRVPADHRPVAAFAMIAGAGVFVLAGFANVAMAIAQGYRRFDLANAVALALTAQQAIGVPVVLAHGWGLRGLVINVGLGWLVGGVLGTWLLSRHVPMFRWQSLAAAFAHRREALRFGGPMQLTNALSVVHQHLDKFLLARFVALALVTPYELGYRVVTAASTFPQLLLLAVLPAASALHAGPEAGRLRDLYERGSRYVLAASVLVIAALIGGANRLFEVWLGPGHGDAALALRGLALTGGVALATGMGTAIARGIGRTDLEARFAFVALVTHLALSLWLVPLIGLKGSLIAILAGNLVGAGCFLWFLAATLGWPRAGVMVRPFLVPGAAFLAAGGVGWLLDRALPRSTGLLGWTELAANAVATAAIATGILFATRYIAWREAQTLLFKRERSEWTS